MRTALPTSMTAMSITRAVNRLGNGGAVFWKAAETITPAKGRLSSARPRNRL
jgi:hypothetical protein